ncbi:MAG: CoA-binding protein [Gammaproteobacteria bacterium]|nr:CoA-binding protein [Gammaproteobacteria bacterium]
MPEFKNPGRDQIRQLLQNTRTIAIVGLSPRPERDSNAVGQALQQFGYKIIPVRPGIPKLLGEKAYPDLHSLPEVPDLVDVFRAPAHVEAIVDSCIQLKVKALWLQEGVIDEESALRAQEAGILTVMNRCIYKEWVSLLGGATP